MTTRYISFTLLIIILLSSLSVSVNASTLNKYASQATPITAEIPKVTLGQGTAGTSTIYTNKTSAKVSVAAPINWLSGWERRLKITIDNNDVDSDLSNFPVLIYLSNSSSGRNNVDVSFVFDELVSQVNRKKIAVTISDGITQTFVEIERWDDTSEQAWLWTKVPSVSSATETVLYLYYSRNHADNDNYVGDSGSAAAKQVWDPTFKTVLHLNQTPSGQAGEIKDSTSYANNGTTQGSMNSTDLVDAKIGSGLEFDEIDDLIRVPNSTSLSFSKDSGTCELWINWANASDGDHQIVMTSSNRFTGTPQDGFEWASQANGNHFFYPWAGNGNDYNLGPNPFTNGVWHHLVVTYLYATKEVKIYVDAVNMSFSTTWVPSFWTQLANTSDWLWGGNPDRPTRYFDGKFDEIRIQSEARSNAWIKASYESGKDDFLDFGSEELNSYYPNSYNVLTGEYLSGNVPSSVQTVDTNYFNVNSVGTSTAYNPLGYSLLGSTAYVSGAISNLASNDNIYMNFRSYVNAISATSKTDAFVAYRSNTGNLLNYPKYRLWDGDTASWGSENEMTAAGSPVRYIRTAVCPKSERAMEKIVVTLSDDGYLDAYVFDGTSWTVTNNIGQVWTTPPADARRPFDIVYESISGDALLVYCTTVAGGTNDLAYRVWSFQSGWGSEQYYDDAGHAAQITVTYVVLASDLISDRIGMAYIDSTNSDANAVIWDGSSWNNLIEITGAVAIATEECIAVASESVSGAFMVVAGEGQFIKWSRFTTSWSNVGVFDVNSGATSVMNWLKLASSQDNRLMLTSVDAASDLCTALWDGISLGNRQWSTASSSMGSMTSTTSVSAMRFTAQASNSVTNVVVYIQAANASSPAYRFGIETSAATYLPSGTYVGGASNYAVYTPTAAGWLNLTLPSAAPLTAGTVYQITVRYDSGTINASNYIALRRMGTVPNMFRPKENVIDPWLNTISGTGTTIQNYEPLFVLKYSDNTFESMPYDTATLRNIYGGNWFSEKWTQNADQTITGINLPLVKAGTPLGSLLIVLRDETNSQDIATITIPQSEITTTLQWYEKYFASPVTLQSGIVYRLILKSPNSTTSGNSIRCYSLSTGQLGDLTYDGTNSFYSSSTNSGSSWTDTVTIDFTYILLSDGGTPGWVVHTPRDTGVDTNAQRCADFAWEYNLAAAPENQGLLVYGTTAGQITLRRFKAPNYMTAATNVAMGANVHPWVQLKSNTRDITADKKILGVVLEGTVFSLGAISWNGTNLEVIGTDTFTSNTTVITYECFEIEYSLFGDPTEFTCEGEFTGTSNVESWSQIVWAVDSSFTTTGVTTTFQLFNYNTSSYPTSGDGYITDTLATTDTTKTQIITANPAHFKDETGNWKMRITGVKPTNIQFDFMPDWVEFKTYGYHTVVSEFLFSSMAMRAPTQLNFTIVSEYNVSGVSAVIQVWNYSSSAYVTDGEGYLNYSPSGFNETILLSINTNPEFYVSNGETRIKITGLLANTTQYQQNINQVKLDYCPSPNYDDYVLKIENQVADPWNIRLRTYSDSNIARISNCTIYLRNSSSGISRQISIENGGLTQDTGPWYDLPSITTIYIAMSVSATDEGLSYINIYLEVRIPNTSTSNLMVVTFEIS